jgi:hypothetical protein
MYHFVYCLLNRYVTRKASFIRVAVGLPLNFSKPRILTAKR